MDSENKLQQICEGSMSNHFYTDLIREIDYRILIQ